MKIFEKKEALQSHLGRCRERKLTIGFVPTMGALHLGHLALIKRAKKENNMVVCSIFVNPTQFNNKEDLKKYPRTLSKDIKMLKSAGCDILFTPDEKEMYPAHDDSNMLNLDFGKMDQVMEGKFRPRHFKGVATIVNKLFIMVNPQKAYFGEKDYQQLAIIKKMVESIRIPVQIVSCKTVRETDGLAMSSRNLRLTREERKAAPFIYKILKKARSLRKEKTIGDIKKWVQKQFLINQRFTLEYFEISNAISLLPLRKWDEQKKAVACIAAYLGSVRLIDNIEL